MATLWSLATAVGWASSAPLLSTGRSVALVPPGLTVVALWIAAVPLAGLAVAGDQDGPIERLTAKVRRAAAGEAVDFSTDRDDEIGALYEAVGDLVDAESHPKRDDDRASRERLREVVTDPALGPDERVERLLELGCDRLGVSTGMVTAIDEQEGRHVVERVTDGAVVDDGTATDLDRTVCEQVIQSDAVVAVPDAADEAEAPPVVEEWGIGCYVGATVDVDGTCHGTLCFVDESPRERPYDESDRTFVDLVARWVGREMERRERIEKLERDASILRSLFEELPVSMYVKDEAGRHLLKSTRDRGGPRPTEDDWYVGKTDLDLYPEEYAEETYADDMSVIETGEPIVRKLEHDARVDEWMMTSKVPWRDADGEIQGLIGLTQYVTERKEYERMLEAIVENTTNPIYIKDCDGVYQFANEATADVFDLDPDEIVGKTDEELFDPDSIQGTLEDDRQVIETGSPVTTETRPTVDGEERVYLNNKYPYQSEDGEIIGVMGISQDITEREERERQLRERERQLSTLMDNVPGMVYRCRNEPDWPFEFVSEGARELTGYEPEAFEDGSVDWNEDLLVGDSQRIWETIQTALDDRESFQVTYQVETPDGERRWLWEQGAGVYDEDGVFEALEGVILDITDRKERERQLQATNERLNAVIEASPDPIISLDRDGVVELWNPAAERTFGWSASDVVGDPLPFVPPERREEFEDLQERLLDEGDRGSLDTKRLTKDGDLVDVNLSAASLRNADDEIEGSIAVLKDITERKEKERELREREQALERYQEFTEQILDALDDVFYVVGTDGSLRRWNSSLPEVTGYTDEEIASMHATEFYPPEYRDRIADAIEEAVETGHTIVEAPYLTASGERLPHEFVAVTIENPEGETVIAGIGRDITERKRRERELERTTDLLSQAEEMAGIGGFATTYEDGRLVEVEWTDKLYDILELPADGDPPIHDVFDYYHPDDRERHKDAVKQAVECGVGWDQELRIHTEEGNERWVRNIARPIVEDGDLVEIRGAIQDITERKARESALETLHETTQELLTTEAVDDATALVTDTAASILDYEAVGIYLYDETANLLEPTALSSSFASYCRGDPDAVGPGSDSVIWHAYVTGTLNAVDAPGSDEDGLLGDAVARSIVVPIGHHGVFVALADREGSDRSDRQLAETLVATAEEALDRIESERELRERDAEIEAQNERLRRQVRINETIRSVDRSLIGATGQAELESDVCERLVESEDIAFAWIGGFEADGSLTPRAWAGDGGSYLDSVSLDRDVAAPEPAVAAAADGDPVAVSNVGQDIQAEDWRRAALAADFRSALAVPLSFAEYDYGVLAVYADEADVFGSLETSVFAELGESIANAVASITTQQALHADTLVSLELAIDGSDDILAHVAAETGCHVSYEGLATLSSGENKLFLRTSGCETDAVTAFLDDRHGVDSYQVVDDEDDALVEVTVQEETLVSRLVRHGGRPRAIEADGTDLSVTVDVPVTTDVRSFVEAVAGAGEADLHSRTQRTRSLATDQEVVETILGELTDRQREVLRTAYHAGFFNWPRDTTGQELAAMLDVSQPTVNRHLRLAHQRIARQLFDSDLGTA